jgi:prepilin-type N-terminal cleavage/methylation domain-containing protein
MKKRSKQAGFTLVELMIVIAVIAILATLGLVGFRSAQASARDTQRMNNIRGVQAALECYFSENGQYPATAAFDNWNDPGTVLGNCWTGGSLDSKPTGDTVATGGDFSRNSAKKGDYNYTQTAGGDGYQIILNGENRTLTVTSPS